MDGVLAMAQSRIPRGGHGAIVVKQQSDGLWLARVQIRALDGRIRSVRVTDRTKGAAARKLERRMSDRIDPTITGVTPGTTFEALSHIWLEYRRDHGKVRTRGRLT